MDKEIIAKIVFLLIIAVGCYGHEYAVSPMAKGMGLFVALFGVAMFSAYAR